MLGALALHAGRPVSAATVTGVVCDATTAFGRRSSSWRLYSSWKDPEPNPRSGRSAHSSMPPVKRSDRPTVASFNCRSTPSGVATPVRFGSFNWSRNDTFQPGINTTALTAGNGERLTLANVAIVYHQTGRYDRALEYYRQQSIRSLIVEPFRAAGLADELPHVVQRVGHLLLRQRPQRPVGELLRFAQRRAVDDTAHLW